MQVSFFLKGFRVHLANRIDPIDYRDANNLQKTHLERVKSVYASYYFFPLGDLDDLCFAKSCVQFFIQSSWRSITKNGLKNIDLEDSHILGPMLLGFQARQKDSKHYLRVFAGNQENGEAKEEYFSVREAMMLDTALSKAINSLAPQAEDLDTILDRY